MLLSLNTQILIDATQLRTINADLLLLLLVLLLWALPWVVHLYYVPIVHPIMHWLVVRQWPVH